MVTDLSIDQIKYSDAFGLKVPKRSLDSTLIIGLSAAVCLIVTALVLTGSLALDMPQKITLPNLGEITVRVKKLTSPFFGERKYILEML